MDSSPVRCIKYIRLCRIPPKHGSVLQSELPCTPEMMTHLYMPAALAKSFCPHPKPSAVTKLPLPYRMAARPDPPWSAIRDGPTCQKCRPYVRAEIFYRIIQTAGIIRRRFHSQHRLGRGRHRLKFRYSLSAVLPYPAQNQTAPVDGFSSVHRIPPAPDYIQRETALHPA